jgi:predicted TPR repeat methyltransferase
MAPPTDADFEQAKQAFLAGVAALEAGRFDEAERLFLSSLERVPGRASTLVNLAATRLQLARPDDALAAAEQALAVEPDDIDAGLHRATALARLGRHHDALQAFDKLLALAPRLAAAWSHRGGILRELGRLDEAARSFQQAVAHGADPGMHAYYLAAVGAGPAPAGAPGGYVQALFDGYAGEFDQHLVQVLGYRAPSVLAAHLGRLSRRRFDSALDLGCGTGLCGPLLKPSTNRLTGVDLSGAMLEKAEALGVYGELIRADIVDYLHSTEQRFDLVVAADVFIYVGDLAAVFAGVRRVMNASGVFCFSAELPEGDSDGFTLLPSLRYAHSQRYLRELAARHGFEVDRIWQEPIRADQQVPVDGLYVCLLRH